MDGVKGVSNEEIVDIRLDNGTMRQGRVVQIEGERIVVQVFEGTRRISLKNTRTRLTGHPMEMPLSPEIIGRVLDGAGKPITLGAATAPQDLQEGNNTLLFSAYLQGDGASAVIVPGEFTAIADFTLDYN